jgi:thioredoxin reductase (NADPH)
LTFDHDVVIVGGGPAGLTAGLHLSRAGLRAIVLEKELFGGSLQHTDHIADYPGFPNGISGAQLAAQIIEQATTNGVTLEQADVSGVELFSRSRWVACSDGRGFSCRVVILAAGTHYTRLGLDNEERFRGRGVVDCTPCDGGFFVDREVVVYGSTDYALRDALYLAELGGRVTVLAPEAELQAGPSLRDRARAHGAISVRQGVRLEAILGSDRVEGVVCATLDGERREQLRADGVLVRIGTEPSTHMLVDTVDLDANGYVVVDPDLRTSARFVLACGDIRSGSHPSVSAAVGDGALAAAKAAELVASMPD